MFLNARWSSPRCSFPQSWQSVLRTLRLVNLTANLQTASTKQSAEKWAGDGMGSEANAAIENGYAATVPCVTRGMPWLAVVCFRVGRGHELAENS